MSSTHSQKEKSCTSTVLSLPPLCEIALVPTGIKEEVLSDSSTRTTPTSTCCPDESASLSSDLDCAPQQQDGAAHPPKCERIHSQPDFRRKRLCATPPPEHTPVTSLVSVQQVYNAIVKEAPDAKVSHVCESETDAASNLIPIRSPADFNSAFENAVPSFILVGGCEKSATMAVQLLRSQARRCGGAVVVILMESSTMSCRPLVEKVPDFLDGGADDVIAMPCGAAEMQFCISVSLAKAKACSQQRIQWERQLRASKKQCHHLFWDIAHELFADFPQFDSSLAEVPGKSVGDMDLVQKLGEGAYGTVYRCEGRERNECVAVKVFPKSGIPSADHVGQIASEFSVLQRLKHENIVAFRGAVHARHGLYMVMEMAGTSNLFRVIRTTGATGLPWSRTKSLFSQIAAGVAHCHQMQVAHCDLKPENIVVSASGCAKLVDFGQSVDFAEGVPSLETPRGTMPFTAPEIMCLREDWDPAAADIWSLGVIMVEMLCGNHAFARLLGWEGKDLVNRSMLRKRADDLKTFFATDEDNSHANVLAAVSGLCHDMPPPFVQKLMVDMLEFMPSSRILAKQAVENINQDSLQ